MVSFCNDSSISFEALVFWIQVTTTKYQFCTLVRTRGSLYQMFRTVVKYSQDYLAHIASRQKACCYYVRLQCDRKSNYNVRLHWLCHDLKRKKTFCNNSLPVYSGQKKNYSNFWKTCNIVKGMNCFMIQTTSKNVVIMY